MATLQRFKILATQCGVAQSPTRSPRTSPVIHLRRRKTTLRMLLSGRRSPSPRHGHPLPTPLPPLPPPPPKRRDTLKDLFVSSPKIEENEETEGKETFGRVDCEVYKMKLEGSSSPRPGWIGFRNRVLIRRAWRPMLAGIPENE